MREQTLPPTESPRAEAPRPFTNPQIEELGTLKVLTQQIGITLDPVPEGGNHL